MTPSPKPRKKPTRKEEALQTAVATYIRAQYPGVVFLSDASGVRMGIRAAVVGKLHRSSRGIPDLIVLAARGDYHGLCLELKPEGTTVFNRDGSLRAGEHLMEQYQVLNKLEMEGYWAAFAIGFDQAKEYIDHYMAKE